MPSQPADLKLWITWLACPLLGVVAGGYFANAGGALLGGVGGAILAWAIRKGAITAALRGGMLGAIFALLIGPGGDWLISGTPFSEKVVVALTVGVLVGGLLGVRNFRPKKKTRSLNLSEESNHS